MLLLGDCLELLPTLPENSVDSIVTDPPYEIGMLSKSWDATGIAFNVDLWRSALKAIKPGGHLLAFGSTRTYHRLVCAIEDAGFEVRDTLCWHHAQGFPKSLDIGKQIDQRGGASISWFGPWLREERERRGITQKKLASHFPSKTGGLTGCVANWELGLNLPTPDQFNILCGILSLPFKRIDEAEREVIGHNDRPAGWFTSQDGHDITIPSTPEAQQWDGWGTQLKPATELICLARKPLSEPTIAKNVLKWGTGAINIDGCRIGNESVEQGRAGRSGKVGNGYRWNAQDAVTRNAVQGRWPANVLFDEPSSQLLDLQSGHTKCHHVETTSNCKTGGVTYEGSFQGNRPARGYQDEGGASRYFQVIKDDLIPFIYMPKASKKERGEGNDHPTVKSLELTKILVRLVTRPGGTVLDPFAGSGTTGLACQMEGFDYILIERDPHFMKIIESRLQSK